MKDSDIQFFVDQLEMLAKTCAMECIFSTVVKNDASKWDAQLLINDIKSKMIETMKGIQQ